MDGVLVGAGSLWPSLWPVVAFFWRITGPPTSWNWGKKKHWFAEDGERCRKAYHLREKSVINMIWLLLPVSDWPIIMISPSGWLLVVSRLFAGTVLVLWVRVEKKVNNRNLDVSWNIFAGSHNDHHGWRCSNYVSMASASQWVWPLLWKLKNYSLYWTSHWFLVFAMVNLCFAYGPTLLTWLYSNQQVFWHATHVWRQKKKLNYTQLGDLQL